MKLMNLTAALVALACTASAQAQSFMRFGFVASKSAANQPDDKGPNDAQAPVASGGWQGTAYSGASGNCGGGAGGGFGGREFSCCDNVWSDYCAQKHHHCQRHCHAKGNCFGGLGACADGACDTMNSCSTRGCGKHHKKHGCGPSCDDGCNSCVDGGCGAMDGCSKHGCGKHHKKHGCGGGFCGGGWGMFGGGYGSSFMNNFAGNYGQACGCGQVDSANSVYPGPTSEPSPDPSSNAEPVTPVPQPIDAPITPAGKSAQNWFPGRLISNAFSL